MITPLLDLSNYNETIATFFDDWTLVPFTGKFAPLAHSTNSYTRFSAFTRQENFWALGAPIDEVPEDHLDSFTPFPWLVNEVLILDEPRKNHAKLRVRTPPVCYGPSDVIHKVKRTWAEVRATIPFDPELYAKYRVAIFARSNRSHSRFNTWSPNDKCAPDNMERYLYRNRPVKKGKKKQKRFKSTVHEPQVDVSAFLPESVSTTLKAMSAVDRRHYLVLFHSYYLVHNISVSASNFDIGMHVLNFVTHYPDTFSVDSLTAMCFAVYAVMPVRLPPLPQSYETTASHNPQADNAVLNWMEALWDTHGPTRTTILCSLAAFVLCLYFKQTSDMPLEFGDVAERLTGYFTDLTRFTSWWEFFQAANGFILDGYASWQNGTFMSFLTEGDYKSFRQRVATLRVRADTFSTLEPGPRIYYTQELYALNKLGQTIKNRLRLTNSTVHVNTFFKFLPNFNGEGALNTDINTLLSLKLELEASLRSAKNRRAPLGVLIHGTSSIGKSSIADALFRYYGAMNNLPQGEEFRFTMNGSSSSEFMSNYTPCKWAALFDDIGAISPTFQRDGDPMTKLIIDAVNNTAFVTNQADLASKGNVPFVSSIVIATSNTKDFGASNYFTTPEAVLRRMPLVITPHVHADFQKNGALDTNKAYAWTKEHPLEFPPFWRFKVETVSVRAIDRDEDGRPKKIEKGYSYQLESPPGQDWTGTELMEFFRDYSEKHVREQNLVFEGYSRPDVTICEHGVPSFTQCNACERFPDDNMIPELGSGHHVRFADNEIQPADEPQSDDLPFGATYEPVAAMVWQFPSMALNILAVLNVLVLLLFTGFYLFQERLFTYLEHRRAVSFMRRWTTVNDDVRRRAVIASASLATGILAMRFYQQFTATTTEAHADVASSTNENFAPWDPGFSAAPIIKSGFPPCADSAAGLDHAASFDAKMSDALKRIIICKDPNNNPYATPSHCHGLMVGDKMLLVNTHSLTNCAPVISIKVTGRPSQNPKVAGVTNAIDGKVSARCRHEIVGTPYTLIYLTYSSCYKDIFQYFLNATAQPGHAVEHWRYLERFTEGAAIVRDTSKGTRGFQWGTIAPLAPQTFASWAATGTDEVSPFVAGHSGSLWLSKRPDGTRAIIGLHEGMSTSQTSAGPVSFPQTIPLPVEALRAAMLQLKHDAVACPTLSAPQNDVLAEVIGVTGADGPFLGPKLVKADVHYKFAGNYLHLNEDVDPDLLPYRYELYHGSEGFRAKFHTAFGDSMMRPFWEAKGYTTDKVPPVLGNSKWQPEQHYLVAATSGRVSALDPDILRECADSFIAHIVDTLPDSELALLQPYSTEVAMYGAEDIKFVDPMNMKTSTGHGYSGNKQELFKPTTPAGEAANVLFHQRLAHIERKWRKGELVAPVYTTCLKDETISQKKQAIGKLRVFLMSPADITTMVRKFMLSYARVAQRNPFVFEQAVGMNCHSSGWGNIARFLYAMGDGERNIAGDYKQFDCTLQFALLEEVRRYFLCLFIRSGNYTHEELQAVSSAIADIICPTVDFFGTFVGFLGLNPTGNPLTVHVNGVSNSLLLRYVFAVISKRQLVPIPVSEFRKHVSTMTYGDDHVCGVSKQASWFNQNSIAAEFKVVTIVYTDAWKKRVFPDFESWSNITFLKRRWIWSEEANEYLAPLDLEVFGKMVCLARASKHVNAHESAAACLTAFVYEHFHHGRIAYDKARLDATECVKAFELPPVEYPSFDERLVRFATTSATLYHYTAADFASYLVPHTKIPFVGDVQFTTDGFNLEDLDI